MSAANRRHDIDWLRVIAIALLLVYHIGIGFQPWGVFIGFIQSNEPLEALWKPMSLLNIWRIPFLFFVSGMGVRFAIRKRNWKQVMLERSRRILLPFLFGMFAIVPLHMFIWQKYYKQEISYTVHPVHLWFLANIFIYVLVLSPLFFYLKKNEQGKLSVRLRKLFGNPLGLLVIVAAFVTEALLLRPESYETYALTLHGFVLGMLAFLFGFILVYSGKAFWQTVKKWKWLLLILAAALFAFRFIAYDLMAPNYLKAIESNLWIFAAFGLAYNYLNHPGRVLSYLSKSAYPVYILHMIFLYLGSYLIVPLELPALLKLLLLTIFTFTVCFLTYDFIIRRLGFLRPLFGLKSPLLKEKSNIIANFNT